MILGLHFIFSAYGFWLPNDPRGSWSDTIRNFDLARFGPATKVATTRSLAADRHEYRLRMAAKAAMKYPPVSFSGKQALLIAKGFEIACEQGGYRPLALALLPDHAHLLLAYHPRSVDAIASHLKAKATRQLSDHGLHPMSAFPMRSGRLPSPWARKYWCPFITDESYMHRALRYVNDNPVKAGLRRQNWSLVKPFRG